MNHPQPQELIITHLGLLTPASQDVSGFYGLLSQIPETIQQAVGHVPVPEGMKARELRHMSKLTRLALYASKQAVSNLTEKDMEATGLYFGVTHGATSFLQKFHDYLFDYGADMASPLAFSNGVSNAPLSSISEIFQLTDGGTTLISLEHTGLHLLELASMSLLEGEYRNCLVGAAEEYSSIVEEIYSKFGWFNGRKPAFLPAPRRGKNSPAFPVSEGSVFLKINRPCRGESLNHALCSFSMVHDIDAFRQPVDCIISNASGGPQDGYELDLLEKIFSRQPRPVPLLFSKPFLGESFAVGALYGVAMACGILGQGIRPPSYPVNRLLQKFHDSGNWKPESIRSILVMAAGRNGQVSAGVFRRINQKNGFTSSKVDK